MASFNRIAEIAQRGLQGGSIGLESLLHYKDNLTFFMFSCMSAIEHDQNEYENGCTRGILRNNPLANKLGMMEDGLSYSPIKVLALTWKRCIGRTYFAYDLLHYFNFVTPFY